MKDDEVGQSATPREAREERWAILDSRDKIQREITEPDASLEERTREAKSWTGGGLLSGNVKRAGVHMALYLERVPACLLELPFVDDDAPPFFHHPERGVRPSGDFSDPYPTEEEEVV